MQLSSYFWYKSSHKIFLSSFFINFGLFFSSLSHIPWAHQLLMLSDILKSLGDTKIFHLNFLKWGDEYAQPLQWILAWIHCNIFFTFSPTVEPDPRQEFKSIHNMIFNLSSKQYNIDNGIPSPNTKEKRPLLSEKSNDREL